MEKKIQWKINILFIFLILSMLISLTVGRYPIKIGEVFSVLTGFFRETKTWASETETIIWMVRVPRMLAAILIGASLATAGASYQGLFQNPMVSPAVLGASAGAGFGAALGILLQLKYYEISLLSFVLGLLAVGFSYGISLQTPLDRTLSMVLSGMMIGSIFSALISFVKLVADPENTLPAITYWLMGSLASIRMGDVLFIVVPVIFSLFFLWLMRWKMNLLTMGEEEAKSMGVSTGRLRLGIVCAATLLTAASVSISGMIGWIGLVIPHFCRLVVGYDYRYLIPASMLSGASYLLLVDVLCRSITTTEIPLGIVTALIGAPVFLLLLLRRKV